MRWVSRSDVGPMLSTLWVYVLLNILFRDIHELFRPGFVEELLGSNFDQAVVFAGGVALQLPLALVVLSRLLHRRWARIANLGVAALMALVTATTWPKDADDVLFSGFELLGLAAIAVLAWWWREDSQEVSGAQETRSP